MNLTRSLACTAAQLALQTCVICSICFALHRIGSCSSFVDFKSIRFDSNALRCFSSRCMSSHCAVLCCAELCVEMCIMMSVCVPFFMLFPLFAWLRLTKPIEIMHSLAGFVSKSACKKKWKSERPYSLEIDRKPNGIYWNSFCVDFIFIFVLVASVDRSLCNDGKYKLLKIRLFSYSVAMYHFDFNYFTSILLEARTHTHTVATTHRSHTSNNFA